MESQPVRPDRGSGPDRIRLACIDMAGTVVNDGGTVLNAFHSALGALDVQGRELDHAMEYALETMGQSKTVVFQHLLGSDERVAQAMAAFAAAMEGAMNKGEVSEIPGAATVLADMRATGVTVCLTTGFSPEVQEAIIEHLGWHNLVDFVLAPGGTVRGRPYPDMVLTAALRTGVDDVREVAVVGDTANDLWSGYRAGASAVVGVLTGTHGRAELERAPHTHILSSILDFPPLVL
jgi:phosphonatase-like hydrolase